MAKKKWKKLLKKAGKAALIGGALYAATKGLKGAKGNVSKTAATEGIKWTPGPQIPDIHDYTPKAKNWITQKKPKIWTGDQTMDPNRSIWRAKGGSAYKHGGSVTGIAKRGFGRALMKGKK